MEMRIRVENKAKVATWFKLMPKQIDRASRLSINQVTNELHKRLGGEIPKEAGVTVVGYRRVRAKKSLAKAGRRKIKRGVTWMGTMEIPAKYAGRMRSEGSDAWAGKYFFQNAFIATMKSGYKGIFYRLPGGKLKQATIKLPKSDYQAATAASWARARVDQVLTSRLKIELAKKV